MSTVRWSRSRIAKKTKECTRLLSPQDDLWQQLAMAAALSTCTIPTTPCGAITQPELCLRHCDSTDGKTLHGHTLHITHPDSPPPHTQLRRSVTLHSQWQYIDYILHWNEYQLDLIVKVSTVIVIYLLFFSTSSCQRCYCGYLLLCLSKQERWLILVLFFLLLCRSRKGFKGKAINSFWQLLSLG